ncbi:MAG: HAMP domain-containing histidine kinase [Clostridium argentinense]|uniref:histidine kinase n=1 Tax=Clostridium faecium TaxID=2762223 RepID=A0ABR8YRE5_9CLOT|nr:HAMP domain-containing sensor histidine kinase [Clostridium faecium]MBD8046806.1 HAMP domain-containing histidine kinase [Clostridium faecium]MBS5824495.1 HAMP domain-containing histidine kinase [Clostridium argentinense]MDU1350479.1 HAMP domain-containing sensor histidine kinase [Clostridium argentinense]
MENKKIKALNLLVVFIIWSLIFNIKVQTVKASSKKEILIINSYDINQTWEKNVKNGFKSAINPNIEVNYTNEYLNAKIGNDEYYKELSDIYRIKYKNKKFDLILVINDEAFKFVKKYHSDIFNRVPVIFIGINKNNHLTKEEKEYFTGFYECSNNKKNMDIILKLHPKVKKLNVILDNTSYSHNIGRGLKAIRPYYKSVKFNFIQHMYIEDVAKDIYNNEENQINIISGTFLNKENRALTPGQTIDYLKKYNKGPFYSPSQDYLGYGVVGGPIDIGDQRGEAIGEFANQIFEGEKISDIVINNKYVDTFVFDFHMLVKEDIPLGKIPENCIIINKNKHDYILSQKQKRFYLGLIFLIVSGLIISGIYYIYLVAKAKKERKIYDEALKYEKLKTEFFANISHELRTPLNVILSTVSLMELYAKNNKIIFDSEDTYTKFFYIKQNALRLLRLVNNIIDITKIDSGYLTLNLQVCNIVQVVEDIVLSVANYIEEKGIELIFDTDTEEKIMAIDEEKIERIVFNLLSNAIKFTNKGGKILVNVENLQSKVRITVTDNGIGIPADKQEIIFDRFTQVDSTLTRKREGSGIGLSLVKSLVEIHGGNITLKSEVNKGSSFIIELPVRLLDDNSYNIKDINEDKSQKVNLEFSDIYD